ncbi:MAG: MBL fold metallo-hydrolase [Acidimicrobiia bacterium]|nr:MBL fold metallo-hydrolase [Acidimicrobiia bacterium]
MVPTLSAWLRTRSTGPTGAPRSTRSWWGRWTTTSSCSAASETRRRRAARRAPTSTTGSSTCAAALGVRTVLETHGHWDHIQAVPAVRDAGYDVGVTAEDAAMLDAYDYLLEDESVVDVGRLRLHTIHTPGHTPGSMCFRLEGSPVLFSGDTLFPGGPGTTKFGGDFPTIIESIDRRLFSALDPDTLVLPGHGDDTTIGDERPHLQEWVDRGW